MKSYDPFDVWATPVFGRLKYRWYQGSTSAKVLLAIAYLVDIAAPTLLRRLMRIEKREYSHVLAMLQSTKYALPDTEFVRRMDDMRTEFAWGLGFKWYSANGIYPETIPFITSAPYVMDALTKVSPNSPAKGRASELFNESWNFLEALKVKYEDSERLALSYAPVDEPLIVVNANSYAAFAYALHYRYGIAKHRAVAEDRAMKLARWVVAQQYDDGRWYYMADRGKLDMIDGFHSCFVVRNLRDASTLLPALAPLVEEAVEKGWQYIKRELYDPAAGLSRRYSVVSRSDPFRYDLYDQAEYLGLLVDFGEIDQARALVKTVRKRFVRNGYWYCRIDRMNRRWGRNFLRWGIAQFWAHEARLNQIDNKKD